MALRREPDLSLSQVSDSSSWGRIQGRRVPGGSRQILTRRSHLHLQGPTFFPSHLMRRPSPFLTSPHAALNVSCLHRRSRLEDRER